MRPTLALLAALLSLSAGATNLSTDVATNTGDIVTAPVGSSPSANGATVTNGPPNQTLTLQPADGTHPGLILAAPQTIGGDKTFLGDAGINGNVLLLQQLQVNGDAGVLGNVLMYQQLQVNGDAGVLGSLNVNGSALLAYAILAGAPVYVAGGVAPVQFGCQTGVQQCWLGAIGNDSTANAVVIRGWNGTAGAGASNGVSPAATTLQGGNGGAGGTSGGGGTGGGALSQGGNGGLAGTTSGAGGTGGAGGNTGGVGGGAVTSGGAAGPGGVGQTIGGAGGAGTATQAAGTGGNAVVRSGAGGAAAGGPGASPGITIVDTGVATGSAGAGFVQIGVTNAGKIQIGSSSTSTNLVQLAGSSGGAAVKTCTFSAATTCTASVPPNAQCVCNWTSSPGATTFFCPTASGGGTLTCTASGAVSLTLNCNCM